MSPVMPGQRPVCRLTVFQGLRRYAWLQGRRGTLLRTLFRATGARVISAGNVYQGDGTAVAFVDAVVEAESGLPGAAGAFEARHPIALGNGANRMGDVIQFVDDRVADGRQSDNHGQNTDGHDQNQFRRNQKTPVVVYKSLKDGCH